jgi:putative tRNA adenosine deaminase-associated protein
VSYFAAAVVRGHDGWAAFELELGAAADVEEVAEQLREVDPEADQSVLFVESDDTYLVILRLDKGEDLRVFGSDGGFAEESRLGALLLGDVPEPALEIDALTAATVGGAAGTAAAGDRPATEPDADPVGDADLLGDLGVPAAKLLALCSHEGMLPADVTSEVCQAIGCGDELEELREV